MMRKWQSPLKLFNQTNFFLFDLFTSDLVHIFLQTLDYVKCASNSTLKWFFESQCRSCGTSCDLNAADGYRATLFINKSEIVWIWIQKEIFSQQSVLVTCQPVILLENSTWINIFASNFNLNILNRASDTKGSKTSLCTSFFLTFPLLFILYICTYILYLSEAKKTINIPFFLVSDSDPRNFFAKKTKKFSFPPEKRQTCWKDSFQTLHLGLF